MLTFEVKGKGKFIKQDQNRIYMRSKCRAGTAESIPFICLTSERVLVERTVNVIANLMSQSVRHASSDIYTCRYHASDRLQ